MMSLTPSRWNRSLLATALLAGLFGAGGCANMSNTDRGVLAGGAAGAGIGALAAGPRHAGAGALIGAAAGAITGGVIGSGVDASERKAARAAAAAAVPPLTINDVIRLTQSGTSDDVIIGQIRTTGSRYALTANDVISLQNAGVREPVIREMQATAYRPARVYTAVPVAEPVVLVPAPPPPPPVGIGFTYVRRRW